MPLSGDLALRLDPDAAPRRVRKGECARFPGEWRTSVELPEGSVVDLNLLCARDEWSGTLAWLQLARRRLLEEFERGHLVLHLVEGALRVRATGEDEALHLGPGDSLWLHGARADDVVELLGEDDATAVVVARIEPTRGARG
jgi:environmental stress-induced protein Ves